MLADGWTWLDLQKEHGLFLIKAPKSKPAAENPNNTLLAFTRRQVNSPNCSAVRKRSVGAPGTTTSSDNRGRPEDGVLNTRGQEMDHAGIFSSCFF